MQDLTPRQLEVYRWIWESTLRNGFQPSFREIRDAAGMKSPNAVAYLLHVLRHKGYVGPMVVPGQNRSLVFLKTPEGEPFHGFEPALRRLKPIRVELHNENASTDLVVEAI